MSMFDSISISASALSAERVRMNVIAITWQTLTRQKDLMESLIKENMLFLKPS